MAKGLKDLLEPLGFIDVSDGESSLIQFERPLVEGGGKQVLEFDGAWGMIASAKSERFRDVRARSSGNPSFKLTLSDVFSLFLSNGRKEIDQGWIGDDPGGMGWEEEMLWAINDVEKVLVPLLQKMQSSKDLFDWYYDAENSRLNRSSFSNWDADIESKAIESDARLALYAARYLPEKKFLAMLDKWAQILSTVSETNHGARVSLKIAEVLRTLPQTPNGPM